MGNQLTYLAWCQGQPSNPMIARHMIWLPQIGFCGSTFFDDDKADSKLPVVCVKCSPEYLVPDGYSCLATDFGLMVVKPYNQKNVTASDARKLCAADANYVHLPRGRHAVYNATACSLPDLIRLNSIVMMTPILANASKCCSKFVVHELCQNSWL